MKTIQEEIQEGHNQAPTVNVDVTPSNENILPPLLMQPTSPMIPMIKTKKRKGKGSGALKKSQKVVESIAMAARLCYGNSICIKLTYYRVLYVNLIYSLFV